MLDQPNESTWFPWICPKSPESKFLNAALLSWMQGFWTARGSNNKSMEPSRHLKTFCLGENCFRPSWSDHRKCSWDRWWAAITSNMRSWEICWRLCGMPPPLGKTYVLKRCLFQLSGSNWSNPKSLWFFNRQRLWDQEESFADPGWCLPGTVEAKLQTQKGSCGLCCFMNVLDGWRILMSTWNTKIA